MIEAKSINARKKVGNLYVLNALKQVRTDKTMYELTLKQSEKSLDFNPYDVVETKAYLIPDGTANFPLVSFDVEIRKPGLYTVQYQEVLDMNSRPPITTGEIIQYEDLVLFGEREKISIKATSTDYYNQPCTKVTVVCQGRVPDNKSIYYTINKIKEKSLADLKLKYYIPFNNAKRIEFVVLQTKPSDIQFDKTNEMYELNISEIK